MDYICNELNECLYYDMLSGGDILNGEVLPPRVGLRTGIRAIYEFVEDKEELFLQFVPGRVFSEYQIPSEAYNCIKLIKMIYMKYCLVMQIILIICVSVLW